MGLFNCKEGLNLLSTLCGPRTKRECLLFINRRIARCRKSTILFSLSFFLLSSEEQKLKLIHISFSNLHWLVEEISKWYFSLFFFFFFHIECVYFRELLVIKLNWWLVLVLWIVFSWIIKIFFNISHGVDFQNIYVQTLITYI